MNVASLGLSATQISVVGGFFSLTFAVFLGAALFFYISRADVAPAYRMAVTISGVIVTIAGYHYFRIMQSFEQAAMGEGLFNEAYRYVDWIVTVPLLLTELVLVFSISADRRKALLTKLIPYSVAMIALGYPGEIAGDATMTWVWWAASMVFFVLILATLFGELSRQIQAERPEVQGTLKGLRTVLLITWSFYPVAYLFPILIADAATGFVLLNVGYAFADITAKAGYGLMIHHIAKVKTELNIAVPA